MSFDALTLSAVRDELEPLLTDARLQKLIFPDELSLAMEVFAPGAGRTNVLLSADLEDGRVQRIVDLPARGLERDSPFSLVARKHLRNAHIRSLGQPRLERVFELHCEQRDASGQHYRFILIVEAMGRRSNLILVDQDGLIMDAARRSPPSRNPRRPVLPHLPYVAPPPQDRWLPEQVSSAALAAAAEGHAALLLSKFLSDRLAGLSPLAGRELAFRATGAADTVLASADWRLVAEAVLAFMSIVDGHTWEPTVAVDHRQPLAFAPYRLSHLERAGVELLPFATISLALADYYARLADVGPARRGDALAAERRALLKPLSRAIESTDRRMSALAHQLERGHDQRDALRRGGEQILAHQAELPTWSTELTVHGERFELDPRLSGSENAQAYFARYRKAREAEDRVPALIEQAAQHVAHLAELRTMVEVAESMDAIHALRREVGAATGTSAARKAGARHKPAAAAKGPYRRVALGDGWEALVGASAAGNAAVTFDLGQADDLWLHARGVPGAHVILRTGGATPPDELVERAAQLAAWHSANRAAGAVEVDVAPRRYVRKIANAPPGLVRYSNERTLRVTPSG
jgi:predicted ribosome quality control (RQC) complex YloA/Tae2 family protein